MKNKISTLITSMALFGMTTLNAGTVEDVTYNDYLANSSEEDMPMIETSVKHKMSRLLMVNTAEVLESYGLAFSGSGNIYGMLKNWRRNGLEGSLILGLGDVVDIGFDLSEFNTSEDNASKRMEGFIKLQAISESEMIPSIAFSHSQSLKNDFSTDDGAPFDMEAQKFSAIATKNFQVANYNIGVHFNFEGVSNSLTQYKDKEIENQNKFVFQPQLGLSWQKEEGVMFILENRFLKVMNIEKLSEEILAFDDALQTNFAVRFHLTNWLMIDTGIRNTHQFELEKNDTEIHANISGVLPLGSLGKRAKNSF